MNVIKKLKTKESDVQKTILDWLGYKKIFHWRNNSGGAYFKGKNKDYYVRYGAIGAPDIIAVVDGRFLGIECKASKGKQSENQKVFQEALEKAGGVYLLVYSVDDVIEGLQEYM